MYNFKLFLDYLDHMFITISMKFYLDYFYIL